MVRVATYVHQMPAAIDMIEDAKAKGYEVTCNIMAISNAKEADIETALEMVGKSSAEYVVSAKAGDFLKVEKYNWGQFAPAYISTKSIIEFEEA